MITITLSRFSRAVFRNLLVISMIISSFAFLVPSRSADAATGLGELEARPAPVGRRICIGGTNAGDLCNQDADCPGSTCKDRNVFNISVAVHYDAPAADITSIQNLVSGGSATLFDVTDGQAEIGQATIHNNAFGTTEADLRIYPATCTSGTNVGNACNVNNDCPPNVGPGQGRCGVWWWANTGSWKNSGSMHVSINNVNAAAVPGPLLAHEFVHLVFDARDEYESRPGCGANTGNGNCPDVGAGQVDCLMDANNTELCWGQGDPTNVTDLSGGNHDATNVTEQSACRSNRSCWDQLVFSWPNTFIEPAAAPDPAAGGAVVSATNFIQTDDTVRVVLVLDESGSMMLESPTRMERLKVAANDFVALAENGTELGIVSYATDAETASGRVSVSIAALGANRATWTNAINGLSPSTRTNIGDGLQKAKDMIVAAGGVTGNTFVVLMTDGLNNEPVPQATADADLQAKVADLLAAGIPVYVTCTGGDLGLQSQCSEIASGTNGFYVDSADSARLPEAFVDSHERLTGREAIDSVEGYFSKIKAYSPKVVYVDEGADSATFTLLWQEATANADMVIIDPDGNARETFRMPQGRYARVKRPKPGNWKMVIDPHGTSESRFVARAYTQNRLNNLAAAVRYATVLPGEDIYVFAYPKNLGRPITHPSEKILARVTLPDGSVDTLELLDQGRDATGKGDDIPGDGIFTGVYKNTGQKGAYNFLIQADMEKWRLGHDAHEYEDDTSESSRFVREVRLSAAVGDPKDVVTHPEDDPREEGLPKDWCNRLVITLLALTLLLILINILLTWRCCWTRKG